MISNTRSKNLWRDGKKYFSHSFLYLFQLLSWTCFVNLFTESETMWLKSNADYSNHLYGRQSVCSSLFMELILLCLENLILNSHLKNQEYFSLKLQSTQPKDRHRQAQWKMDMQCVAMSASSLHPPSWGVACIKESSQMWNDKDANSSSFSSEILEKSPPFRARNGHVTFWNN